MANLLRLLARKGLSLVLQARPLTGLPSLNPAPNSKLALWSLAIFWLLELRNEKRAQCPKPGTTHNAVIYEENIPPALPHCPELLGHVPQLGTNLRRF